MRASDHPRATYYYHIGSRGNPRFGVRQSMYQPARRCWLRQLHRNNSPTTSSGPEIAKTQSRRDLAARAYAAASRTNATPPIHGRRHAIATTARTASAGTRCIAKSAMARSSGLPDVNASNANRLRTKLTAMPRMRGLQSVRKCFRLMSRTSMKAPAGEVVSAR